MCKTNQDCIGGSFFVFEIFIFEKCHVVKNNTYSLCFRFRTIVTHQNHHLPEKEILFQACKSPPANLYITAFNTQSVFSLLCVPVFQAWVYTQSVLQRSWILSLNNAQNLIKWQSGRPLHKITKALLNWSTYGIVQKKIKSILNSNTIP